jgi:hypothetical protein
MTTTPANAVTMTGADLHRLLTAVLPSAATDDTLPQLSAVHLETGPSGIYAVATDRYTFAVARHADPDPGRCPARLTVPRTEVTAMLKLARRRDPAASIRISGGQLTLRTAAGTTYRTPAVNPRQCGSFPDWRRLARRLLAAPEIPGGQPVWLNPAYLARFAAATDGAGVQVSIREHTGRCHAVLVTAGDWFLGVLVTMAVADPAAAAGPAAWHAHLTPVKAA